MNTAIENVRVSRTFLMNLIQDLSIEELNLVPPGFNNNIIWNIGHLISSQQGICYLRANLKPRVAEIYLTPYRPGTKPESAVSSSDFETIKEILFSSLDQLEEDLSKNLFSEYKPWVTRYGVNIADINDALGFLPYHEGLHAGYVMALKRIIKNK